MAFGKALSLSQSDLERMSIITDADIQLARESWVAHAPRRYLGLISGKGFNNRTRTYGNIDPLVIRSRSIEPYIAAVKLQLRALTARLQKKEITLAQWQTESMGIVKQGQVAAALVANGGDGNQTQADREKIAAIILILLLLFKKFADDIMTGAQLSNGLLIPRVSLYADAGRGSYESMLGYINDTYLGMSQERRVLGEADHCSTQGRLLGCIELAKKGWQLIGSLPAIGISPCYSNCKCHFEYR